MDIFKYFVSMDEELQLMILKNLSVQETSLICKKYNICHSLLGKSFQIEPCSNLRQIMPEDNKIYGQGTYAYIFSTNNDNIVVKRNIEPFSNYNDKEAKILKHLSDITSYFPHFYGYYECSNGFSYLAMEKVKGKSFTLSNKIYNFTEEDRRSILFQITHALYEAGEAYKFNHNDLIGQNIMIEVSDDRDNDIQKVPSDIGNFVYDRRGLIVKIVDFGFSRITADGENIYNGDVSNRYYDGQPVPYQPSADLCKIYGNPVLTKGIELYGLFKDCNYNKSYMVVPPFPKLTPEIVLMSDIFNNYRI